MYRIMIIFLLFTNVLLAEKITIAVAANVSYAIEELKAEFAKVKPNVEVLVILGSSGKLRAQIKNGAPYGLFMSANMKYPQALFDDKIAITKPAVYAQGTLAYFSVKKRDFSQGMELLEREDIRRIALANPKTAPYGKAAMEAIQNAGLREKIKDKFVYAESISQTVSYAVTATDIGLIAKSALHSPKMTMYKEGVNWSGVRAELYTPIKQGIVLLKHAQGSKSYQAFYDFVLSDRAKEIFKKYGYLI